MADKDSKDDKPKIPPVVKLKNGGKKFSSAKKEVAPGDTARISLPSSTDVPPRVKRSDRSSSNTSRIDLGSTGESPGDTSRIDLGQVKPDDTARIHLEDTKYADSASAGTDRIDLSKAHPVDKDTDGRTSPTLDPARLQAPNSESETTVEPNTETSRIDLAKTQAEVSDTEAIGPQEVSDEETRELMKRSTVPIEVTLDDDDPSAKTGLDDRRQSAKRETAKLGDAPVPSASVDKSASARINLEKLAETDDVFKRTAAGSTVASLAGAAAAMQNAKKTASATTKNETARIDVVADGKGGTARIELPEEDASQVVTGRKKTIKLKKRVEVARRPTSDSLRPAGTLDDHADKEDLGLWPSVVSVLTLIAMGVLVYVLAAQSVAPDLPFPGKL